MYTYTRHVIMLILYFPSDNSVIIAVGYANMTCRHSERKLAFRVWKHTGRRRRDRGRDRVAFCFTGQVAILYTAPSTSAPLRAHSRPCCTCDGDAHFWAAAGRCFELTSVPVPAEGLGSIVVAVVIINVHTACVYAHVRVVVDPESARIIYYNANPLECLLSGTGRKKKKNKNK